MIDSIPAFRRLAFEGLADVEVLDLAQSIPKDSYARKILSKTLSLLKIQRRDSYITVLN